MRLKYNKYTSNKEAFEILERCLKGNNFNIEYTIEYLRKLYGVKNATIIIDQANFYKTN